MRSQVDAAPHSHSHVFTEGNPLAERNTRRAVLLTAVMMVVEIAGGWYYNSMALLADGWHMSSHVLALGLAVFAYACSRRYADDPRFAFGTWKIEVLGGYTSAVLLLCVALLMVVQSIERLVSPLPIHYTQAIALAAVGLLVNLVCAWWLKDSHHHGHHGHGHAHEHGAHGHGQSDAHHQGHDHAPAPLHGDAAHGDVDGDAHVGKKHADINLRAAYLHVLADAATSVLAIVALVGGRLFGAAWLDAVMGIVGAALVTVWAWGLLRESGRALLDAEMDAPVVQEIRDVIADTAPTAVVSDLHVWRVAGDKYACIVGLVTPDALQPAQVRDSLGVHDEVVHVTVEINAAPRPASPASAPGDVGTAAAVRA